MPDLSLTVQNFVEPFQLRVSINSTTAPLPNFNWYAFKASDPNGFSIAQAANNYYSPLNYPQLASDTLAIQVVIPGPGTLDESVRIEVSLQDAQGNIEDAHPDPWDTTIVNNPYELTVAIKVV